MERDNLHLRALRRTSPGGFLYDGCRHDFVPGLVDMYTTVCDCCGERLFLSDDHGDENITLCESCYERHYTHCERCGRVISYSDAYYEDDDEDEPLCYDCLQARLQQATIHDYSYTPRLIFHGERDNERFFGVELEIDGNGKSRKIPVKS